MRIGIDLGGTKTEVIALGDGGGELVRRRVPTPKESYDEVVATIRDLVLGVESELGAQGSVGVAIPGTISPITGLVKNANATRLIGHPIDKDLSRALSREVRVANDANCFALSEATDGAAAGCGIVFGIIAGTGVGGGVCVGGRVLTGAHAIAGEWGHNPLPGARDEEVTSPPSCYCGRKGCIEAWCSGPALEAQYKARTGHALKASEIDDKDVLDAFLDRFSRAIASVVNIIDPDAIVIGGGLSNIDLLYRELPSRVEAYAFSPQGPTRIVKNRHGDSSGVRGAAWLWPQR